MSRRSWRLALVAAVMVVTSAHVGSPTVVFDGAAGPYPLRVIVRPPSVVPGIAQIVVRSAGDDITRISVRPVFWRAGTAGAPAPDDASRTAGDPHTWSAQLWLMARGAYGIDVAVEGKRGNGRVMVPVESVATGRLGLSPALGATLVVLGLFLCAGLITIVYDAAGESLVPADSAPDARGRRRARFVASIAMPVIALTLFGGARWWNGVDTDYARTIARPIQTAATISTDTGPPTLRFRITDPQWMPRQTSPLMPDHGKIMHLFLVGDGNAVAFAHLHPVASDSQREFDAKLPPLPAGPYHLFADVVHETGFERTLTATVQVPAPPAGKYTPGDPDDAWLASAFPAYPATAMLPDGSRAVSIRPASIPANEDLTLRFHVADPRGAPAALEPYMGMAAHAIVVARDQSVFVHLHPMGTVTMAAQQALALRDAGDTMSNGRLNLAAAPMAMSPPIAGSGDISIPYAFPKAGDYRIYLQVRRAGRILTAAFDAHVSGGPSDTSARR